MKCIVRLLVVCFLSAIASAQSSIDIPNNGSSVYLQENPDTNPVIRTLGQTFVVPGADTTLTSFALALTPFTDAGFSYRVYLFRWDTGSLRATGTALFTSPAMNSGQIPSFAGLKIALTQGTTYVVLLTTQGVVNDAYANGFLYHNSGNGGDVYPGGAAYQQQSPTANGSTGTGTWTTAPWATVGGGGDFQFSANFEASSPDLAIVKQHSGNFTQGQSPATFSLLVSNIGVAATSGQVSVTDTLPTTLSPLSASGTGWSCSFNGQTMNCTRSDALAGGASFPGITLSVSVAPDAPATVLNTGTVSGGGDQNSSNNASTDTVSVNSVPNLTITKTHTGTFVQGGTGVYTLRVQNIATSATSGQISVVDSLPEGLADATATGIGWVCSAPSSDRFAGQTLNCIRSDSLAGGQSFPAITLTANVAANAPGTVTNVATVSGGGDATPGNNSASDATSIQNGTDLKLTKSHSGNFIKGQQGTYNLTVTNVGTGASANPVSVTDHLPVGLTAVSASGTGWNCPPPSGQSVTCQRTDVLAAAASYPAIGLVVVPGITAAGTITNTATVSGGGDINPNNNSASDPTTILGAPNMTINKSHVGNFTQGQSPATFFMLVTNLGDTATVGQVTVTDTLPSGLSPVSATGTGWACSINGQTLTCTRSDSILDTAYSAIHFDVSVAPNAPATISNTAFVSGGGELITSDSQRTDTVTVLPAPDLSISKTHSGTFVQGQTGTYTISVSNGSTAATSGQVSISDGLPTGLTPTTASGSGWGCSVDSHTVNCSRTDSLGGGQTFPPISAEVSVATDAPSIVTNSVTVSGGGDVTPDNNRASDTTPIGGGPDLTISKTHSGNFVEGQNGSFTITVSNAGPSPTAGASTFVRDTLPANLTPISASGNGWACSIFAQTMTCGRTDVLGAGASYPAITLSASVVVALRGAVTNSANVSGGGDVNSSNNTASDTVMVEGGPDLIISKTHTGDFRQGQQGATYTLTVANQGESPTSGTVSVNDTVPTALTPVSAAGTGWTCTLGGQAVSCSRSVFSRNVAITTMEPVDKVVRCLRTPANG